MYLPFCLAIVFSPLTLLFDFSFFHVLSETHQEKRLLERESGNILEVLLFRPVCEKLKKTKKINQVCRFKKRKVETIMKNRI